MFEIHLPREQLLKNVLTRHIAATLSSLWFSSVSSWTGDLNEGQYYWEGDDGDEFLIIWNAQAVLGAACVFECDRFIGDDDGWDEDRSPTGKKRGLQYLNSPPSEVLPLYIKSLHRFSNGLVTAGFWGVGPTINYKDDSEESEDCGLSYFSDFAEKPEKFLSATSEGVAWDTSLNSHFGFKDELAPLSQLTEELAQAAFVKPYQFNMINSQIFSVEIKRKYGVFKTPPNWREFLNDMFKEFGIHF